jgi:hypothetical protein
MRYLSAVGEQDLAPLPDASQREEFQRFCDRVSGETASRGMTADSLNELVADEEQAR